MRELQKFINQINKENKLDKIILILGNILYLITWIIFAYCSSFSLITNIIWLSVAIIINILVKKHDAKKIDLAILDYLSVPLDQQDKMLALIRQSKSSLQFVKLLEFEKMIDKEQHDDAIEFFHKFNEIKNELSF